MSWNYRLVRRRYEHGYQEIAIHEVYYNKSGEPYMCTEEGIVFSVSLCPEEDGQENDFVLDEMERFRAALDKPILDYDIF